MLREHILAGIVFLFTSYPTIILSQLPTTIPAGIVAPPTPSPQIAAPQFDTEFLNAHNLYRQQYNLPPLQWDDHLANFSCNYANQRSNDCQMIHSTSPYGENLFWGGGKDVWTPSQVVKCWIDERDFYDFNTLQCQPNQMCGHFTQVVWKDTAKLGCGSVECKNGDGWFFICAYDPPGNYADESPFGGLVNVSNHNVS